jgi:hypothetical protein
MDINKFMDLVELTRMTTGKDWVYNRRVLRLKLRYLIECEVKKLHKHNVSKFVARCEYCQCELTLVRPGKYQCDNPDCSRNVC